MTLLLTVFVAGAGGAACRYLLDGAVQARWDGAFPVGTLVVNLTGALLLGIVTGFVTQHTTAPAVIKVGIGTGFIGAFTTFSTLAYESLRLLREGAPRYGVLNLVGSTAAGLLVAAVGLALGARI
ncbi:MAG: fluoride efflux transporter CrcB [Actinomycetota bacterium]